MPESPTPPNGSRSRTKKQFTHPRTLRLFGRIGLRMPAHCTSTGKVLLAHLPPDRLDEVLVTLSPPVARPGMRELLLRHARERLG